MAAGTESSSTAVSHRTGPTIVALSFAICTPVTFERRRQGALAEKTAGLGESCDPRPSRFVVGARSSAATSKALQSAVAGIFLEYVGWASVSEKTRVKPAALDCERERSGLGFHAMDEKTAQTIRPNQKSNRIK